MLIPADRPGHCANPRWFGADSTRTETYTANDSNHGTCSALSSSPSTGSSATAAVVPLLTAVELTATRSAASTYGASTAASCVALTQPHVRDAVPGSEHVGDPTPRLSVAATVSLSTADPVGDCPRHRALGDTVHVHDTLPVADRPTVTVLPALTLRTSAAVPVTTTDPVCVTLPVCSSVRVSAVADFAADNVCDCDTVTDALLLPEPDAVADRDRDATALQLPDRDTVLVTVCVALSATVSERVSVTERVCVSV
mmetsp:Transcript_27609/g.31819  ORF Transcript_27609/g.31819 Transcript_27609/m.31819 type:complete len:255 (-) Transcript_27609:645-1409(-)